VARNASPAMKEICDGTRTEAMSVSINAMYSILFCCESDSNEIEESDQQPEKQPEPRTSTQRGIIIDFNEL
jgi:hypothetical protein